MRFRSSPWKVAMTAGWATCAALFGQAPTATTPPPSTPPAPVVAITPLRLADPPVISTLRLPADNPFGANVETPALPPPKPVFTEGVVNTQFFGAVRVDRAGR